MSKSEKGRDLSNNENESSAAAAAAGAGSFLVFAVDTQSQLPDPECADASCLQPASIVSSTAPSSS